MSGGIGEFAREMVAAQSKVLHEDQGQLSRAEKAMAPRVTAADLLAFMGAERADVRVKHTDGSGWDIFRSQQSFWTTAWDTESRIQFERHCSTFHEALEAVSSYVLGLPR